MNYNNTSMRETTEQKRGTAPSTEKLGTTDQVSAELRKLQQQLVRSTSIKHHNTPPVPPFPKFRTRKTNCIVKTHIGLSCRMTEATHPRAKTKVKEQRTKSLLSLVFTASQKMVDLTWLRPGKPLSPGLKTVISPLG